MGDVQVARDDSYQSYRIRFTRSNLDVEDCNAIILVQTQLTNITITTADKRQV
jgi:hypothetical protein